MPDEAPVIRAALSRKNNSLSCMSSFLADFSKHWTEFCYKSRSLEINAPDLALPRWTCSKTNRSELPAEFASDFLMECDKIAAILRAQQKTQCSLEHCAFI